MKLEPITERRITGTTFDSYGAPQPVRTTYIIGHGQQLARVRLGPLFAAPVPEGRETRQQVRRVAFKARKAASARALKDIAFEMLKIVRVRRKSREIAAGAGA